MKFNPPKNTDRISWTNHSVQKMIFYGLSEQKVRSILIKPKRKEEGVAPGTIAVMKPAGSRKRPTEIWVMYQTLKGNSKSQISKSKLKIISAWRYPGISPVRGPIPIPEDILEELNSIL